MTTATVDCAGRTVREINREIRREIAAGSQDILVLNPEARHNLGVGVVQPVSIRFDGSVGYYCGGMMDGPNIHVSGSAGWGVAEGMMGGSLVVEGSAGNSAGAAIRGGMVVIKGDAGARTGVSIKGGTLLIEGSCGYMTGFMGQTGTIIVRGDADRALGDSMYETVIFVGGNIADLGSDAVIENLTLLDREFLQGTLAAAAIEAPEEWQKVVSGRKLWNFDRHESAWQSIL